MKRNTMIVVVLAVLAMTGVVFGAADANAVTDVNEVTDVNDSSLIWVVWPMAGEDIAELRLGVEYGIIEGYVAPGYNEALEGNSPDITNLTVYGICNAVNAKTATELFPDVTLPDGAIYAGIFGGWSFTEGESSAGWLVGARLEFAQDKNVHIDMCTEYQQTWHTYSEDQQEWALLFGPRISF